MYNTGEFKFKLIDLSYGNLLKTLELTFDDYISEDKIKICNNEYTIYSKQMNLKPNSRITAHDQSGSRFILDTFLIVRENKNHCYLNMTKAHVKNIKSRLVSGDMKKVRLQGKEYVKNKIFLIFD